MNSAVALLIHVISFLFGRRRRVRVHNNRTIVGHGVASNMDGRPSVTDNKWKGGEEGETTPADGTYFYVCTNCIRLYGVHVVAEIARPTHARERFRGCCKITGE